MTTVTKTDLLDHQSSDVYEESCTTSFDIGHRETKHVPVDPSSLAKINLVDDAGDGNAHSYRKRSPPSGKISKNLFFWVKLQLFRLLMLTSQ